MTKAKKGFTLIEIVIVLAIAALILVIVFLAVAGANRAQRDNQRKADAGRVLAAAQQYAGNNSGNNPTSTDFIGTYKAPTTGPGNTAYNAAFGTGAASSSRLMVVGPGTCGANGAIQALAAGQAGFAVSVYQENGGAACVQT
ncbi:type II secretion system protein [Candidatus Saccharibacteria bacterium]|nr:type II secretion system protein [Candidatus Saccharibacteria bacterium]